MDKYTEAELRSAIASADGCVQIPVGAYVVSVAYGLGSYCTPEDRKDSSFLTSVEVAIFKNGYWVLKSDMEKLGLNWVANHFEPDNGSKTSVAGYVLFPDVCRMINDLRELTSTIPQAAVENKIVDNKNDYPCKFCGTGLNVGESPCWKCGTNNPTY